MDYDYLLDPARIGITIISGGYVQTDITTAEIPVVDLQDIEPNDLADLFNPSRIKNVTITDGHIQANITTANFLTNDK